MRKFCYKRLSLEEREEISRGLAEKLSIREIVGRLDRLPSTISCKIHKTESGDWVRSKSEVIIANILFRSGIKF